MRLRKGNPLLITTAAVGALVTAATVFTAVLAYYRAERAVLRQADHDGEEIVKRIKTCALEDPVKEGEKLEGPRTPLFFVKLHLKEIAEHRTGYAYVLDKEGDLLADSRFLNALQNAKGNPPAREPDSLRGRFLRVQGSHRLSSLEELLHARESGAGLHRRPEATAEMVTFTYVPRLDWLILYHRPYRDVQATVRAVGFPILAVAGFIALIVPLMTLVVIKKVISPYVELRARERYKDVIDAVGDGIVVIDHNYTVVHANRVLQERYGDTTGRKCYEAHMARKTPCTDCPVRQVFATGQSAWETWEIIDGSRREWVESHATPLRNERGEVIAAVEVLRDITQRRQLEMELMLSARLRALGELATGIAHEISTPMLGILTFSDMVEQETAHLPLSPETRRDLDLIRENARRVVKVTDRIRAFARHEPPTVSKVDLNESVQKALELLRYQMQVRGISVSLALAPSLPCVWGNGDELIEVIINLLVNAIDAVSEKGVITIQSRCETNGVWDSASREEGVAALAHAPNSCQVLLQISDTGCGIASENLERIFEPGFSTKAEDGTSKGLGLGLFLSRGMVESFGGTLSVQSDVGGGATFTIAAPSDGRPLSTTGPTTTEVSAVAGRMYAIG